MVGAAFIAAQRFRGLAVAFGASFGVLVDIGSIQLWARQNGIYSDHRPRHLAVYFAVEFGCLLPCSTKSSGYRFCNLQKVKITVYKYVNNYVYIYTYFLLVYLQYIYIFIIFRYLFCCKKYIHKQFNFRRNLEISGRDHQGPDTSEVMALMGWHGEPLLLGSPEEIPSRQFWGWSSYDGTKEPRFQKNNSMTSDYCTGF